MSQPLVSYTPPAALRSNLLLNPPDSLPPTEELETVQVELNALKQRALERAKKADDDLRAIELAIKKMREKAKGKAKAIAKVKREPSYTPSLDNDDRNFSPNTMPTPVVVSPASVSLQNLVATPPFSKASSEQRRAKKKEKDKKRKRDLDDSDVEETQRPRKFSPLPPPPPPFHPKPSKLGPSAGTKVPQGPDWSVPDNSLLLPPRPPVQPAPVAGPSKPIQVTDDFSKLKAPSQIPVTTFYASIEPWLRNIREEDVGWLEYTADEVEPYVIPQLGRHYTELWEEEDTLLYGGVPTVLDFSHRRQNIAQTGPSGLTQPKWDPLTMTEGDTVSEKGHGPVTERLVTALLQATDKTSWQSVRDAEDAYEARPPGPNAVHANHLAARDKCSVADLEERVRNTARFNGMLQSEPDFSQPHDDPISTALRQAQRQLREVVAVNKARKARLTDIALDRLAYQEYCEFREVLDKNINTLYAKLQKKDRPKVLKKKKKGDSGGVDNSSTATNGIGAPLPNPATTGLTLDEDGKLSVADTLKTLVGTRKQWVNTIGSAFDERQREYPGRIWGTPQKSIFEGIEEEVRAELQSLDISSPVWKWKEIRTDTAAGKDGIHDLTAG